MFQTLVVSFEKDMAKLKIILFLDESGAVLDGGYNAWTYHQLKRLRYVLIEFAINYCDKCGGEVTPNTMHNYKFCIQLFLVSSRRYDLKLTQGHVFAGPKEGLLTGLLE